MKGARKPAVSWGFPALFFLFEFAESSLFQVISTYLSILFYIDNLHLFQTLFFISHIFNTNPVPLHFFIIGACLSVFYSQNIFLLACLSTYGNYNFLSLFLQQKDCDTMIQMFYKLFSRDCITILLLQISIENHPYYFNNSSSSPTRSHTANLHSTEKRMYHSHLLLFQLIHFLSKPPS